MKGPDLSKRIVYSAAGMKELPAPQSATYKIDGGDQLKMNVYSPQSTSEQPLPVVLFVHGGPIPAEMTPPTEWGVYKSYGELVAASGFIGVTFNHRLFDQKDYNRSQEDIAAAIAYVRVHAEALHADTDRIALWIFSGGGPHLSWVLRDRPAGLRCVLAFYAILDLRPFAPLNAYSALLADIDRFSAVAQVKEYGAGLPMFIARAGLDTPQINQGIDRFIGEALAANATIVAINHAQGRHGFDMLDDNERSREIIRNAVQFLQSHLTRSQVTT